MRHIVGALLALALIGQGTMSWAESSSTPSTPAQVGYGVGGALGTLLYAPVKGAFCVLGAVGSAFTAIGSRPTARKMLGASCRGTWAITAEILQGREKMKFVGDTSPEQVSAGR